MILSISKRERDFEIVLDRPTVLDRSERFMAVSERFMAVSGLKKVANGRKRWITLMDGSETFMQTIRNAERPVAPKEPKERIVENRWINCMII